MLKNMAFIFFGISYLNKYKHWNSEFELLEINYKNSIENYKEYLFEHFNNLHYNIDVFICTNNSYLNIDIINDYNVKSYLFLDNRDNINFSRNEKIINAINLCLKYSSENNKNYVLVLITRFDLEFRYQIY